MATAATAENAAENKKIETDMVQTTMSVFLVNPIKTPGYAGGISELQLQAKTS